MAAPTVTFAGASSFTDNSASNNITGVSWSSGDTILVLAMTEDQAKTFTAPTNANLTFAALTGLPTATANSCKGYGWKATAASSQTGQTIALAAVGAIPAAGGVVYVISGATSAGVANPVVATDANKTVSVTRGGANSAVAWIAGDWSASTDVTVTSSPVGGTQRVASLVASQATFFAFDWPDEGAAGSTGYGIANASGTGTITKVAVEILGTASGDAGAVSPAAAAAGDLITPGVVAGSALTSPAASGAGDTVAPSLSATAAVTSPIASAAGDVPAPSLSAGAAATSPVAAGVGDMPAPAVSGSVGWEDLSGETAATLDLEAPHAGYEIRCVVVAENVAGESDPEPSNTVGPVTLTETVTAPAADATGTLPAPAVSVGSTLASPAADGAGDLPAPSVGTDAWSDIVGSTSSTYDADETDEGYQLRCVVTATNIIGSASAPSNETATVDPAADDVIVTAPPMDATGDVPTAGLPLSVDVGTGPLSGAGDLVAPAVTGNQGSTVIAPVADGSGDVPVPAVTADAPVTSPIADGLGSLPAPGVSASAQGQVISPAASGAGALVPPAVIGTVSASVTAPVAAASGALPAPSVGGGLSVTAPVAAASGALVAPGVAGGDDETVVTVLTPAASGSSDMPVPGIDGVFVYAAIPSGGRIARPKNGRAELVGVT